MLQPDRSVEMSNVKVRLAVIENIYCGCCVFGKKEQEVVLCLVFPCFYVYPACASSPASRHQPLDQSPLLTLVTFSSGSGER